MNSDLIDRHAYRGLMRNVAGQVSIIAAAAGDRRRGLTVSAVCSVSDQPPTIIACVNQAASAHNLIIESGYFSINALASDQEAIARVFSGNTGLQGDERFLAGHWSIGRTGSPLLRAAVCQLECRLSDYTATASHTVFFGQVVAGNANTEKSPLIYLRGAYAGVQSRNETPQDGFVPFGGK